jgi:hypothetical protein
MKNIFLIILALIVFGCDVSIKDTIGTRSPELVYEFHSSIPVNSKSSNFSLLSQSWENDLGELFLIRQNYFSNDLNYLFVNSLSDSTVDLTLEFEIEGPNGVGNITEFYFHSFDSIFLIDRYRYLVSLVDSSGKVNRSYRLKEDSSYKPNEDSVLPWSTSKSRIFKVGEVLYIPCIPDSDPYLSQYQRKNLLVKLNIESGEYSTILGFPESYQSGKYFGGPDHIVPSITPYKSPLELLVSFPLNDSIFLFDTKSKQLTPFKWMPSNQREHPSFISYDDRQTDKSKAFQLGTDYYFSINYDPIKNEIWRVFFKQYDEESIENMLSGKSGKPNEKTLLRLNLNTNTLTEVKLEPNSGLNFYDLFVLEEGIIVSVDSLEDRLIFKRIVFQ